MLYVSSVNPRDQVRISFYWSCVLQEEALTLILVFAFFVSPSITFIFVLDDVSLSRDFSISFQFRTYKRDGLLLALDASEGHGLVLQQRSGKVSFVLEKKISYFLGLKMYLLFHQQLVLNYTSESSSTKLSWMPSSNTTHDSYIICQLDWYNVQITKRGTKFSMIINKAFEASSEVVDGNGMMGTLSLGDLSGKVIDNRYVFFISSSVIDNQI